MFNVTFITSGIDVGKVKVKVKVKVKERDLWCK